MQVLLLNRTEIIGAIREIAFCEQFHLLPQCFQKLYMCLLGVKGSLFPVFLVKQDLCPIRNDVVNLFKDINILCSCLAFWFAPI